MINLVLAVALCRWLVTRRDDPIRLCLLFDLPFIGYEKVRRRGLIVHVRLMRWWEKPFSIARRRLPMLSPEPG